MADVAVVGGGILGATAALHLARAGADVILLERQPALGTQTTAAGAGFVGYWAGELEAELAEYGMRFYADLQERSRGDLGVRRVGLLFPALSEPGVEMLRQEYERELHFAPDVVMLDEAETLRVAPILAPGSVHGALFQPDAYQVDTGRVMRALEGELRAAGVDVRTGTAVAGAVVESGRVTGVRTSAGTRRRRGHRERGRGGRASPGRARRRRHRRDPAARVALHHRADRRRHPRAADDAVLRARPALPARAGRRPAGGGDRAHHRRSVAGRRGRSAVARPTSPTMPCGSTSTWPGSWPR